jgi:hypothetical protein
MITAVLRYKTSDNLMFDTEEQAKRHENDYRTIQEL